MNHYDQTFNQLPHFCGRHLIMTTCHYLSPMIWQDYLAHLLMHVCFEVEPWYICFFFFFTYLFNFMHLIKACMDSRCKTSMNFHHNDGSDKDFGATDERILSHWNSSLGCNVWKHSWHLIFMILCLSFVFGVQWNFWFSNVEISQILSKCHINLNCSHSCQLPPN